MQSSDCKITATWHCYVQEGRVSGLMYEQLTWDRIMGGGDLLAELILDKTRLSTCLLVGSVERVGCSSRGQLVGAINGQNPAYCVSRQDGDHRRIYRTSVSIAEGFNRWVTPTSASPDFCSGRGSAHVIFTAQPVDLHNKWAPKFTARGAGQRPLSSGPHTGLLVVSVTGLQFTSGLGWRSDNL